MQERTGIEKDSFFVIVTFCTTKSYNSKKGIVAMKADVIDRECVLDMSASLCAISSRGADQCPFRANGNRIGRC